MGAGFGGPLEMFVIYERPRDFPHNFVTRRWAGMVATDDAAIVDTLEQARAAVPSGLVCLDRMPGDDECIREVWV